MTYEDAIETIQDMLDVMEATGSCYVYKHNGGDIRLKNVLECLRDQFQAEKDGRLVVLPCKVGDTVYVIGEKRIMRCDIDEAYLDDKKGLEYLVSFDCDSDCAGCPFSSWRQDYSGEYSCDGEYGQAYVMAADIGKTVFWTLAEAEAALQKGGE